MTRRVLDPVDAFAPRHLGPRDADVASMLATLGVDSLETLADQAVPPSIRVDRSLDALPDGLSESDALALLRSMASKNEVRRTWIGMGYYGTNVPPVIQRNVLESPAWYTQYTPYQAEIAQGRLEALLNFQTMVADLTGLPIANASLLDEATAAAEAMALCRAATRGKKSGFFVEDGVHPHVVAVVAARAKPIGVEIHRGAAVDADFAGQDLFGILLQYPNTDGAIEDYAAVAEAAHASKALVAVATDLLALTLLTPPGEWGADVAVGSAQRFGVPFGLGGPHAAFMSVTEKHQRKLPGRVVGVSIDPAGRPAYRLAIQTREQHIRRDKATSNICTAQVLLAIMASMYGVYHGPGGLTAIARRVRAATHALAVALEALGATVDGGPRFGTLRVRLANPDAVAAALERARINLRRYDDGFGISLDETVTRGDLAALIAAFSDGLDSRPGEFDLDALAADTPELPAGFARSSEFLTHPVFNSHHSETEMLRYIHSLQAGDLSLAFSMIALGSCTMKLNGTSQMVPVTWPEFGNIHPFAPRAQWSGYSAMFDDLERWLAEATGFDAVSLQPNAGSQGEYAGLLTIKAWQEARGEHGRDVCLIPTSAHGTNPASAVMAGFRVVGVACDEDGNIDVDDLRVRAAEHADRLGALMVTYPSTHGVFETSIREVCAVVHEHGGRVYLDGANMNAQVGLCRPADYGADVCHLNLHKTFCIPHGGGGPGMGPIGVTAELAPFLPGHPLVEGVGGAQAIGPVSAAPYGSPSILPIPWMYIATMGRDGLTKATQVAILNANYMAERLSSTFEVLYRGPNGRVAHEFILDMRPFKKSAGVTVTDIAKRLMDYGFHAPTVSFPVVGTLMIEPTESESRAELDRFCDALIAIREEIRAIEEGRLDAEDNPLKRAPHTAVDIASEGWDRGYSRELGAYPAPWVRAHKFWPLVGRIDEAYGDRNLMCTCPPWHPSQ